MEEERERGEWVGAWEKEILREGGGKDGKSFLECTQYRSPFSLYPLSGGGGGELLFSHLTQIRYVEHFLGRHSPTFFENN